jgi:hypothetical protein
MTAGPVQGCTWLASPVVAARRASASRAAACASCMTIGRHCPAARTGYMPGLTNRGCRRGRPRRPRWRTAGSRAGTNSTETGTIPSVAGCSRTGTSRLSCAAETGAEPGWLASAPSSMTPAPWARSLWACASPPVVIRPNAGHGLAPPSNASPARRHRLGARSP